MKSINEIGVLTGITTSEGSKFVYTFQGHRVRVEIGLQFQRFNCSRVKFDSTVIFLDVVLASVFACIVGLQSRSEHPKVLREF